jgi:hypothetical protein
MLKKHVAACAAAAALVLTGLGSTVASPAFADVSVASTKCDRTYTASENVKIHVTDHGGPPGSAASPAPPKNGSERENDTVIGLLLRGKTVCNVGPVDPVEGGTYDIGSNSRCAPGKGNVWSKIRYNGMTGWVPTGCGSHG